MLLNERMTRDIDFSEIALDHQYKTVKINPGNTKDVLEEVDRIMCAAHPSWIPMDWSKLNKTSKPCKLTRKQRVGMSNGRYKKYV